MEGASGGEERGREGEDMDPCLSVGGWKFEDSFTLFEFSFAPRPTKRPSLDDGLSESRDDRGSLSFGLKADGGSRSRSRFAPVALRMVDEIDDLRRENVRCLCAPLGAAADWGD